MKKLMSIKLNNGNLISDFFSRISAKYFDFKKGHKYIFTTIHVLAIVAIVFGAFTFVKPKKAEAAWYDAGWGYRVKLTINETSIPGSSALTNFPVLVSITNSGLQSHAQADGDDILFTQSDGTTQLSHEIEQYTSGTGTLVAWVKIPSLSATVNTDIYMYYGNSSVSNQSNVNGVWDSSYVGVWHLGEANGSTRADSTSSSNTLSENGTGGVGSTTGKVGNSASFTSSSSQYLNRASPTGLSITGAITIESWANETNIATNATFVSKDGTSSGDQSYKLRIGSSKLQFAISSDGTNLTTASGATTLSSATWYHFAAIFNPSTAVTVYLNGTQDGTVTSSVPATMLNSTNGFEIGSRNGGSNLWDGTVDEVRVSNVVRSADWIQTGYNNQSAPGTFITVSTEETKPVSNNDSAPDPIVYWKMNESTGTSVKDSSSSGYNGTNTGAAITSEDMCLSEKCLYFDGADQIDLADTDTLSPSVNDLTISFWARTPTAASASGNGACGGTGRYMVSKGNVNQWEWAIENDNNNLLCVNLWQLTTNHAEIAYSMTINDNQWHHYYIIIDYLVKTTLYIDGRAVGSVNSFTGTMSNGTSGLQVGRTGNGNYYVGYIDEVKIYNYAKTAAQALSDYNSRGVTDQNAQTLGRGLAGSLSSGLVGYWKLDESSGLTKDCTTVVFTDSSGNGNGGKSCSGTTGPDGGSAGKYGKSVSFDGTNDYINLSGTSPSLTSFTTSGWFKSSTSGTRRGLFSIHNTSGSQYNAFFIYTDNKLWWETADSNGSYIGLTTSATVNDGNWHFFSGVRDSINQKIYLYVDGLLILSQSDTRSGNFASNEWHIGEDQSHNVMNGSIDDVRVFSRALSATEIQALYDWAPTPVLNMPFDENTGTSTVYDSSVNGFTGTMSGFSSTDWMPGKFGGSLNFDASNNYISVADNNILDITNNVSVSAWIKPNGLTASDDGIVVKGGAYELRFTNAGKPAGKVLGSTSCGGGSASGVQTASALTLGNWYHITWTYDGTTNRIYVNGVLNNTSTETCTIPSTANALEIGRQSNYFNGQIDNVHVYNFTQNTKQVVSDMNASHPNVGSPVGSPIGYWKMDEGTGTTLNNGGSQGSTLNMTTSGSPAWLNTGKFGKALDIDGVDDYAYVADSTVLSLPDDMTISSWFKLDTLPSVKGTDAKIVFKEHSVSPWVAYELYVESTDNKVYFDWVNNTPAYNNVSSANAVTTGIWYYATAVKSGTQILLYLNGILQSTATVSGTTYDGDNRLLIGAAGSERSDGQLDEIKLYNYALNQNEIYLDYNQGKSVNFGASSTESDGLTASNSQSREYCVTGDTSSCAGPVGEWKMDENAGTSIYDTSGNANTGTLTNGPTWTQGKTGGAIQFDGTNDYIDAGSGSTLRTTGAVTLEVTFMLTTTNVAARNLIGNDDAAGTNVQYALWFNSGASDLEYYYGSASNFRDFNISYSFTTNIWYHIVVVDNGSHSVAAYLNGIPLSVGAGIGTGTKTSSPGNVAIGRAGSFNNQYFNGVIDNVKIFNYARTGAQMAWDFNRGGPVAWYKFDECTGTTANDASGNSNTGTLTIGATGTYTSAGTCSSGTSTHAWNGGTTGKFNSSIGLDGTNDYISIPDSISTSPQTSMSVSLWVNQASLSVNKGLISKWNYSSDGGWALQTNNTDNTSLRLFVATAVNDPGNTYADTPSGSFSTGWHHIVLTYNGEGGPINPDKVKIFIDGVEQILSFSASMPSLLQNPSAEIRIGDFQNLNRFWNGLVDDVRIYNYPLNKTQIQLLYNGNFAVRFGPNTGSP